MTDIFFAIRMMWPNAWFADLQRTKAKATPSPTRTNLGPTQLTKTMPSSSYSDWQLTPTRPSYAELCQATSYAGLHMAAIAINRSRRFCQTLFRSHFIWIKSILHHDVHFLAKGLTLVQALGSRGDRSLLIGWFLLRLSDFSLVGNITDHGRILYQTKR